MLRVITAIAGLLTYVGGAIDMSAPPTPTCTHDVNRTVLHQINGDSQLYDVIAYLRRASVPFFLTSSHHQRIKESEMETFDYDQAQPVKLIVRAEGYMQPNQVREVELLTIVFGEAKHISSISCQKIYIFL
jgi:hypothetical protein